MPRRLVYYVACTLDGFIARQNGSLNCFLVEGEHFADLIERYPETFPAHLCPSLGVSHEVRRFDTVLMGRHTYELGLREGITNPYGPLQQFVVSSSMKESPNASVELCRDSPVDLVRRLKEESGMDIWLCGGGKLAAALFAEIDEFVFKINPVLIGSGIPLFDGTAGTLAALLIEHKVYANGFVLARYAPLSKPDQR